MVSGCRCHLCRYHRIDLGQDDCLDDEELKLDRDLGPPKKRRNCGKLTRNCFIVCTVLLTIAGLVSVVAYTAIIFPEGPTKQLSILYKKANQFSMNSRLIGTLLCSKLARRYKDVRLFAKLFKCRILEAVANLLLKSSAIKRISA